MLQHTLLTVMDGKEYPVGFIGTVNHFLGFQETFAAYCALQIFNNKSHPLTQMNFPGINFTIAMAIVDDNLNDLTGMSEVFKLIESGLYNHFAPRFPMEPVLGLIGPRMSSLAKSVSLVTSVMDISTLSYAATSRDLSNKNLYPSFCRMVPSTDVDIKILGDYIKHFGWKQIAILTCDLDECIHYTNAVLKQKDTYGYEVPVLNSIFTNVDHSESTEGELPEKDEQAMINDLQSALESIKERNIRVIVVAESGEVRIIRRLYKVMESMNMYSEDVDHGYVVITRQGSNVVANVLFDKVEGNKHRSGSLTLRYKSPSFSNPLFTSGLFGEWDQTTNAFLGSVAPLANSVGTWMGWAASGKYISGETSIPMAFDAVMVYFKAIYDLETSGTKVTRKTLMNVLPDVVVHGASGTIQFDQNCDRELKFELLNLRDDLPVVYTGVGAKQSHDWHSVATWTPPAEGETFGSIELNDAKPINWGTGLGNLGVAPPDYMVEPLESESMSVESMILIAIGSVTGVLAIGFFARYIHRHCMAHEGAERFDANEKQKKRVMWNIVKALCFFIAEISDFVTDALSASSVFALMGKDVISPIFVILYLSIIFIAGLANFGSVCFVDLQLSTPQLHIFLFFAQSIARTKNFIDLIKEYREGISITSAAGHGDEAKHDGSATMNEVNLLRQQSLYEDVEALECLSAKTLEVRRLIRVEKFVLLLGFVEDLPFAIMNSILLLFHRDHINYSMIYASTLLTCVGFGIKLMSFRIIYVLNSELKYLKEHGRLQRTHSVSKAVRKLSSVSDLRQLSLISVEESKVKGKKYRQDNTMTNCANEPKPRDLRAALESVP